VTDLLVHHLLSEIEALRLHDSAAHGAAPAAPPAAAAGDRATSALAEPRPYEALRLQPEQQEALDLAWPAIHQRVEGLKDNNLLLTSFVTIGSNFARSLYEPPPRRGLPDARAHVSRAPW
jgi:hypothetical protein